MALFWTSLVLSLIGITAAGELNIIHVPPSLRFMGSSPVYETVIKDIYSAALGLSVEDKPSWDGLSIVNPFQTPEAVVEVYIDGITSLGIPITHNTKTFPVIADEFEPSTFDTVSARIKQHFHNSRNNLVNIVLSDALKLQQNLYNDVFGEIEFPKLEKKKFKHLKHAVDEDLAFIRELEVLKSIIRKVKMGAVNSDNLIDFYEFRFTTLHYLVDYHGPKSGQVQEAKALLAQALADLNHAFVKIYSGSVMVTVAAVDVPHTRRSIRAADSLESAGKDRVADDAYSVDYPAIFNIILWFGVVMVFTLVAIVYALADMDPGRDSIIYRMTSTRMKKDN